MADFQLNWSRWSFNLSERPHIMGIINVTPDSFSDGGDFLPLDASIRQGLVLVSDGADFLDVGGESTRPGAAEVSAADELARVVPVIEALTEKTGVPISIDTYKAEVAEAAIRAGASMVNDISAGRFDPDILQVAARAGVPYILMHMQGRPRTMQEQPVYNDLMGEVKTFLADRLQAALDAGISEDKVILDPGVGFGKTFEHNLTIINRLREFAGLGRPILMGASRKAFLGRILGGVPARERDLATAAVSVISAYNGAHIHRVHDVKRTRQALAVTRAVMREHAQQN